jgi:drug/metabolite transporter (DMT)-like permease
MERRRGWIVVLAIALAAVGLVWIGQGLGILRGSGFMVNDVRWAIIGLCLVVAGVVLGGVTVVRSRASR